MWAIEWNESVNNEWNEVNSTEAQDRPQKCPNGTWSHLKNKNKRALQPPKKG